MTGKADFSDQEWHTILEGPTSAGLIVSKAERGGTLRESFSMASAYTEARGSAGASALVDEIVQSRPKVERVHAANAEEFQEQYLQIIREAVALLEAKASAEELEDYRQFTLGLAERVAGAKTEDEQPVSDAERAAIGEVSVALGFGSGNSS